MNQFKYLSMLLLGLVLSSCGGGGDNTLTTGNPDTATTAAALTLIQNTGQLQSASDIPVEITAIVTDQNGGAVASSLVTFSANNDLGAILSPSSAVETNENGIAQISLTTTNKTNRTITISASSGAALTSSVTVDVVGTSAEITGPTSVGLNDTGSFSVLVSDSAGAPLGGEAVAIVSANANTITAASLITGTNGRVNFDVTVDNPGDDQITVTTGGAVATADITVLSDSFAITDPAPGTLVPLGTPITATLTWQQNGVNVVGQDVTFSTTRGTFAGSGTSVETVTTNGLGQASVSVSSNDFGVTTLTATDTSSGIATSINVEFVATVADAIKVEAALNNVIVGQSTTLEATVTDPNMNPVKNKLVTFGVQDITGGGVSPGSAITDSNGVARTTYTAGQTTSNDVIVTASVVEGGVVVVSDTTTLSVAGQEFGFDIGTGNSIVELTDTIYGKEWTIIVTDGNQNPVANSEIQVSGPAIDYRKGVYQFLGEVWVPQVSAVCPAEDVNNNGILDPGEDANNSGKLEPSNVVSIAPIPADAALDGGCEAAASTQGNATLVSTNGLGVARICVIYNQNRANWAQINLTATAGVSGSESTQSQPWVLVVSSDDIDDENVDPPGNPSPFGTSASCADTL